METVGSLFVEPERAGLLPPSTTLIEGASLFGASYEEHNDGVVLREGLDAGLAYVPSSA